MSATSTKIKRFLKRFLTGLLIACIVLGILGVWAWHTIRTDHAYTIRKVKELARNHLNASLDLSSYQLKWVRPFPSLDVVIEDIRWASALDSVHPVLRANHLQTRIDLRGWWHAKPEVEFVEVDSAWVHLRKNAEGRSNVRFAATSEEKIVEPWNFRLVDLPKVSFNYLDFHNENLERNKWQRAQLKGGEMSKQTLSSGEEVLKLTSDVHFDGLYFKPADGGFLVDYSGRWDLNFAVANNGLAIKLHPSHLYVDSTEFALDGILHRADTNRLILHIRNEGVMVDRVLPMLSDKIQFKLGEIEIDQPVQAAFHLNEQLYPDKKGRVEVDFMSSDASVRFRQLAVDRVNFKGYFSNDCDRDGVGGIEQSCVVFEAVEGDLYGVLPTIASGRIDDLSDPHLTAEGTMEIVLPRLNERLRQNNKVTFRDGKAMLKVSYHGPFNDIILDPFNEDRVRMQGSVSFTDVIPDLPTRSEPLPALSGQMNFNDEGTQLQQLNLNYLGSPVRLSGRLQNLPEFLFFEKQALQSDLQLHFDLLDFSYLKANASPNAKNFDYQKVRDAARKIASNINGRVDLKIDRLRYDTFEITDLHTRFALSSPLLYEENDTAAMIKMERLSGNFDGNTPFRVGLGVSREEDPKFQVGFDFPDAQVFANTFLPTGNGIKSGSVAMRFQGEVPLRSMNSLDNIIANMKYDGRIVLDGVEASIASVTWPVKTLTGTISLSEEILQLSDLTFQYEGSPFYLNGQISDYRLFGKQAAKMDLTLKGRSIDWRNNQHRKKVQSAAKKGFSPVQIFRELDTVFQLAHGRIDLTLDSFYTLNQTFSPLNAELKLGPEPLFEGSYQLELSALNIGLGGRNEIKGYAKIANPVRPKIEARIQSVLNFKKLADFLPSDYIRLQDGFFRMDMDYVAQLTDSINAKNYLLNAVINGAVEVVNGKLFYNYRDFQVDSMYAKLKFNNRDLKIDHIALRLNGNELQADGSSRDFFPFFVKSDRKASIALDVRSPSFDFGAFTAPHGLGKDTIATDSSSVFVKTGSFVDQLLSNGSLDMKTDFDELKYETFLAQNLRGFISLHPDTVLLDSVQMKVAEGDFLVDGSITQIVKHEPKIFIDAEFKQSNVSQLLYQFQSFGQPGLDSTNVKGRTSFSVSFSSDANSNYSLLPATMYGDFQFKLFGGQLINLPGVNNVSGFISKKRQLDHIIIDTLQTYSHLRGSDLYINPFRLESTSFDFDVEGIYSLGEEDNTRILFGVPLSNLYRRYISKQEREQENKARKGLRIFIEAREHPRKDKMRLRWKIPFSRQPYRLPEENTDDSEENKQKD